MAESHALCTSGSKICAANRVLEQNLGAEDDGETIGVIIDTNCTQQQSRVKVKEPNNVAIELHKCVRQNFV